MLSAISALCIELALPNIVFDIFKIEISYISKGKNNLLTKFFSIHNLIYYYIENK